MSDPTTTTNGDHEIFEYVCTNCPLGCRLEIDVVDGDVLEVRGHTCKKGERYGKQEHLDPRREVSTTMWLAGGPLERLPVRAAAAVPKPQVKAFVAALGGIVIEAPVSFGQVLARDVAGTGIDVIATRAVDRVEHPALVAG